MCSRQKNSVFGGNLYEEFPLHTCPILTAVSMLIIKDKHVLISEDILRKKKKKRKWDSLKNVMGTVSLLQYYSYGKVLYSMPHCLGLVT